MQCFTLQPCVIIQQQPHTQDSRSNLQSNQAPVQNQLIPITTRITTMYFKSTLLTLALAALSYADDTTVSVSTFSDFECDAASLDAAIHHDDYSYCFDSAGGSFNNLNSGSGELCGIVTYSGSNCGGSSQTWYADQSGCVDVGQFASFSLFCETIGFPPGK